MQAVQAYRVAVVGRPQAGTSTFAAYLRDQLSAGLVDMGTILVSLARAFNYQEYSDAWIMQHLRGQIRALADRLCELDRRILFDLGVRHVRPEGRRFEIIAHADLGGQLEYLRGDFSCIYHVCREPIMVRPPDMMVLNAGSLADLKTKAHTAAFLIRSLIHGREQGYGSLSP